jgi:hypothetical protein
MDSKKKPRMVTISGIWIAPEYRVQKYKPKSMLEIFEEVLDKIMAKKEKKKVMEEIRKELLQNSIIRTENSIEQTRQSKVRTILSILAFSISLLSLVIVIFIK